jgi:predicted metal-dependent peptidase
MQNLKLEDKFSKVRIQLLWDKDDKGHAFYGIVLVKMKIIEKNEIDTFATDGKDIFFNREYADSLSFEQLKGVIVHEVKHRGLKHHIRQQERDAEIWNIACDLSINPIIKTSGLTLPDGGLFDPQFIGWSSEKIYNTIAPQIQAKKKQQQQQQGQSGDGQSSDDGDPTWLQPQSWGNIEDNVTDGMSPAELKAEEADVNEEIFQAVRQAKQRGTIPAEVKQMVEVMKRSEINWQDIIERHVEGDNPHDFSYRKMHRKFFYRHAIVAPTIESYGVGHVVVGVDSSGSVSNRELQYFLGGLNALSLELKPKSVTVITCDSKVQNVYKHEQGDEITKIRCNGRGGTCVMPVFDYIKENDLEVDSFIYFTDMGIFDFPKEEMPYPVLWVSTDLHADKAPIGQTTYLKVA